MSNAVYPGTLAAMPGLAWPVTKAPAFNSKVQQSVSFMELRAAFAPYPQWKWTLVYNVLAGDSASAAFQTLCNFYLARQGQFDSFLYDDPSDDSVTDQVFGTGDGSTTTFQLLRTFIPGGFAEYVYNTHSTPVIKNNGVVQTPVSDYTISASGLVTFVSAPANTHVLTWTGTYYWRVRFADDSATFTEFLYQLWSNGAVSFVSVLGS